jgi:hypothetical protein
VLLRDFLLFGCQVQRFKQLVRLLDVDHVPALQTFSVAAVHVPINVHVAFAACATLQVQHSNLPVWPANLALSFAGLDAKAAVKISAYASLFLISGSMPKVHYID